MESVDESSRTVVMRATGQDKRGQGGAKATIESVMRQDGAATTVDVVTDFTITGRLARFGRGGMIQDVSNRLLKDFSKCLAEAIEAEPAPALPEPVASSGQAHAPSRASKPAAAPRPVTPAKPVKGLSLLISVLVERLKRLLGR